jgi:hypothetical protein
MFDQTQDSHEHGPRIHGAKFLRILVFAVAGVGVAVLFAGLFGWLVQILWNWLMPPIFGLKAITYWQGFGIILLAKILFGGMAHSPRRGQDRFNKRFHDRARRFAHSEEEDGDEACMPGNGQRWGNFRQYWNDEGRTAFKAYVQKRRDGQGNKPPEK